MGFLALGYFWLAIGIAFLVYKVIWSAWHVPVILNLPGTLVRCRADTADSVAQASFPTAGPMRNIKGKGDDPPLVLAQMAT